MVFCQKRVAKWKEGTGSRTSPASSPIESEQDRTSRFLVDILRENGQGQATSNRNETDQIGISCSNVANAIRLALHHLNAGDLETAQKMLLAVLSTRCWWRFSSLAMQVYGVAKSLG